MANRCVSVMKNNSELTRGGAEGAEKRVYDKKYSEVCKLLPCGIPGCNFTGECLCGEYVLTGIDKALGLE